MLKKDFSFCQTKQPNYFPFSLFKRMKIRKMYSSKNHNFQRNNNSNKMEQNNNIWVKLLHLPLSNRHLLKLLHSSNLGIHISVVIFSFRKLGCWKCLCMLWVLSCFRVQTICVISNNSLQQWWEKVSRTFIIAKTW